MEWKNCGMKEVWDGRNVEWKSCGMKEPCDAGQGVK